MYQFASASNTSQQSFLSGTYDSNLGMSYQVETYFPEMFDITSDLHQDVPFTTSSLFGVHDARDDYADLTWASGDVSNFQVYAVRDRKNSRDAYFKLSSSTGGPFPTITSSLFRDVYENKRWNVSVRIKPSLYPLSPILSGTVNDTYIVEFYGYNYESGELRDSFELSSSVTLAAATASLEANKRLYLGAHRTNFTGAVVTRSDVKLSSARVWYAYLEDEVLTAHAIDASSYGTLNPSRNFPGIHSSSFVPERETLGLHWDFASVTGSDVSGQFTVPDINSGSFGSLSDIAFAGVKTNIQYPGRGDKFPASSTQVVDTEYIHSYKLQPPDVINSSDMVNILGESDTKFTRETRPLNYFFAIEKSMQQIISEEMMNMFATLKDFHNVIGHPVNRYRMRYNDLDYLRTLYFRRVQNEPDFEKFVDYYKWIDSSISAMIDQLIPASAEFASNIRTVIESHVLERNKYWSKFPTQERKEPNLIGSLRGVNELRFNWRYGHHPLNTETELHTSENIIAPIGGTEGTDITGWTMYLNDVSSSVSPTDFSTFSPVHGTYAYRTAGNDTTKAELRYSISTQSGRTIRVTAYVRGGDGTGTVNFQGIGVQSLSQSFDVASDEVWYARSVDMIATASNVSARIIFDNYTVDTTMWVDAVSIKEIYTSDDTHCLYWKEKAERTDAAITSGDSIIDTGRTSILGITSQSFNRMLDSGYNFSGDLSYVNTSDMNSVNKKSQYAKALLEFGTNKYLEVGTSSVSLSNGCEDGNALVFKKKMEFKVTQYD